MLADTAINVNTGDEVLITGFGAEEDCLSEVKADESYYFFVQPTVPTLLPYDVADPASPVNRLCTGDANNDCSAVFPGNALTIKY